MNGIVDAMKFAHAYAPPFSNLGARGRPTTIVRDAKGEFVCTTFSGAGFTLDQLRERARWVADALNRMEGGAE